MGGCPGSLFTMNEEEVYYSWETKESGPRWDEHRCVQLSKTHGKPIYRGTYKWPAGYSHTRSGERSFPQRNSEKLIRSYDCNNPKRILQLSETYLPMYKWQTYEYPPLGICYHQQVGFVDQVSKSPTIMYHSIHKKISPTNEKIKEGRHKKTVLHPKTNRKMPLRPIKIFPIWWKHFLSMNKKNYGLSTIDHRL